MKKSALQKLTSLALVLVMLLTLFPAAFAGDEEIKPCETHVYEDGVCTLCGAKEPEPVCEHVYEDGVCSLCGAKEPAPVCEHVYEDGVCSLCGAKEPAPVCEHVYEDGVCTLCGAKEPEPTQEPEPTEKPEATDAAPAGSDSKSDGGVTVSASWGEDVFPAGTYMSVSYVGRDAALAMAAAAGIEALDGEAVDISFFSAEGDKIQPAEGKTVSVSITLGRALEGNRFTLLHQKAAQRGLFLMKARSAGGEVETVGSAGASAASFAGGSFSVYAIVGENAVTRVKVNFQGMPDATQIVKAGDSLVKPVDPTGDGDFLGWKMNGSDFSDSYFGTALTAEQIAAIVALTGQTPNDDNHNLVVGTLVPAFDTRHTVRFWTTSEKTQRTDTRTVADGAALSLGDINYIAPTGKRLTNWTDGTNDYTTGIAAVTADMDLWPELEDGHWLHFETNGGTLIAPQFVLAGEHPFRPADPAKQGYIFESSTTTPAGNGWYADAALTIPYVFDSATLSTDTTVYAKWTPGVSEFNIRYWVQNAEPPTDPSAPFEDDYTYYGVHKRFGPTDGDLCFLLDATENDYIFQNFSIKNIDHNIYCKHYTVNQSKLEEGISSVGTIRADGSTILDIYMDRIWYQLTFNPGYGTVHGTYVIRWGQSMTPFLEIEYPRAQFPTYWDTEHLYGFDLCAQRPGTNQWNTVALPACFVNETKMRSPSSLAWGGFEIPNGAIIQFNKGPYLKSGQQCYKFFSFFETVDSTQDYNSEPLNHNFEYRPSVQWANYPEHGAAMFNLYQNSKYYTYYTDHYGTPTNSCLGWRTPTSGEIFTPTGDPVINYDPDYPGTYNYRWYAAWNIRQRYDLEIVILPDNSADITEQDIMWGVPLSDREPEAYPVGTQAMIDGRLCTLEGWYADSTRAFEPVDFATLEMPTKDLTIFARWEPIVYDVTIHYNVEGVANTEYEDVVYGTILSQPELPDNGDKVLYGWYTSESFDAGTEFLFGAGGTAITADTHIYARWAAPGATYTVKYMPNGDPSDTTVYADGAEITLKGAPGTIPAGWRFLGWTLTETEVPAARRTRSTTPAPITGTVTANAENAAVVTIEGKPNEIELYPLFTPELSWPTKQLSYHANYPVGTEPSPFTDDPVAVNGEVTIASLAECGFTAPEGYVFMGWNSAANGSGEDYAAGDLRAIDDNADLYAKWAPVLEVELTGSTLEKEYNGGEQSNDGYTVVYKLAGATITSLPEGVTATLTATQDGAAADPAAAKGTDVGSYTAALTLTLSKTAAANVVLPEQAATAEIVLIITPKPVTLKSATLTKMYDGKPLTNGTKPLEVEEGWIAGGDGELYLHGQPDEGRQQRQQL